MSSSIDELAGVLRRSQELGFLGQRPIDDVIEHARGFVVALRDLAPGSRVIDLGAGGGVPGLVIAIDRPDLRITLLDRRTKRTDFLEQAVRRLGWTDRVEMAATDVARFLADGPPPFDAVVARGFGPPEETLRWATSLVGADGVIVISEPPAGDRWDPAVLADLGVRRDPSDGRPVVARFVRSTASTGESTGE
ncbi:MAG TPA: RsmG family class I SAM-dependent methyltransferase [Ilumatobacteraceae bacterium]|nr:RsmG family class I SAM-dependent methyltransferase [Ilumatobacteraceae bacterium]